MGKAILYFWTMVFSVFIAAALPAQIVMDPTAYLETAKATADIARVVSRFNRYLERNDPVFHMHGDVNIPLGGGIVPSYAGVLTGEFQGFDAFMYVRLFENERFSARMFGIWSNFGFHLDDAAMATPPFGFDDDHRTGWISGYGLFGAQTSVGEDRYTFGAILRYEPTISLGPPAQFSYWYDDVGDFRTSEISFERVYADATISGWHFDTLLSLEAIERLAVAKLFSLSMKGLSVGPAVQYLGRLGSFRPGFESEWKPASWFEARIGASAAIGVASIGLGEATLDLSLPLSIDGIGDAGIEKGRSKADGTSGDTFAGRVGSDVSENRNLLIRFDVSGSLLGTGDGIVPGGKAELTIDNARGLTVWDWLGWADVSMGASAGISWNHVDTLARMPFEDQAILYLRLMASVY